MLTFKPALCSQQNIVEIFCLRSSTKARGHPTVWAENQAGFSCQDTHSLQQHP